MRLLKSALSAIQSFLTKVANGFSTSTSAWNDGEPSYGTPRSFVTTGMRLDDKDPKKVIPVWRYNASYYRHLS